MRHEYRKAVRTIAQMQKTNPYITMLRSSTSFTLGHYTFSEIVESARKWAVWLSAWVYGERPVGDIPRAFPLPARFNAATPRLPHGQVWGRRGKPTASETESESEVDEDGDADTERMGTSGEKD